MVHPTNLFRSDSERDQGFSAPVGNYFNDIDCGITALPCLTQRLRLQKLANLSVFIIVLSLLGLVQGIISTYFKGTSHLWFSHYNFPSFVEEWFVFFNEIFVGIFALCISYWGNRIHRATWIGALTMLIAVAGGILAIPEIYNPFTKVEITSAIKGPALCDTENEEVFTKDLLDSEGFNEVTFGYFFVFQIVFSMVTVAYISLGLSYIDDHISSKHSPALLGLSLATLEFGKQVGIYFAWIPYVLTLFSIFSSPIWIILIIITFLIGVALAMFPKILPNLVIKKSVNSLVSLASGGRVSFDMEETEHSFFKTLGSLLRNKILLLNILSFVFIQSALTNFSLVSKYFNQSKYHVPVEIKDSTGYSDPDIIQFTTNLLRQPLVAISLVTCGMIISKLRPKAKYLVIWNITAFLLVMIIFASSMFWNCTKGIYNEHKHAITIPFCSSKCNCPHAEPFQPVCVDGKTFFSPCLAGCKNYSVATQVYHDCSCGAIVTKGSCDQDNCKFVLAFAQVNNIIINGLVASTIVVNFLITFRSVSVKYKATAIGLELTFLGIIPFIPIKLIYHFVANIFCEIQVQKGCQYFSENFPTVIAIVTITIMFGGVIISCVLLYFINDLNIYSSEFSNHVTPERHHNIHVEVSNNSGTSEEHRSMEENSPFIKQLGERIRNRLQRPHSRQDRIKSYIDEGDLVPSLQTATISPSPSATISASENNINQAELGEQAAAGPDTRPSSRNNKRNSKASGESDMSSLYKFADNIVDVSDDSEPDPTIKISEGKIVLHVSPQINVTKSKRPKHEHLVLIAPSSIQPRRPAPVPEFLKVTNI
ncbi:unnamed protein product [Phyllotreta striolata]|uniref:Kazal-like domain-containing protein n=1 Tax=Phyllotreta striolata TaxID=444603 RepID=A0A9N9THE1_PHYSR|nr:unnamed protein product [Phyllotreta striolata]